MAKLKKGTPTWAAVGSKIHHVDIYCTQFETEVAKSGKPGVAKTFDPKRHSPCSHCQDWYRKIPATD